MHYTARFGVYPQLQAKLIRMIEVGGMILLLPASPRFRIWPSSLLRINRRPIIPTRTRYARGQLPIWAYTTKAISAIDGSVSLINEMDLQLLVENDVEEDAGKQSALKKNRQMLEQNGYGSA